MNKKVQYNIHGLFFIKIDSGLEDTNRIHDFLELMHRSGVSSIPKKEIIIQKVNSFSLENHRELGDKLYISSYSIIDLKYGIEVILENNRILLNTKYRFVEWLMYSIQLILLKVNCVLIHGAALSRNGKALLFPSWGGVGKTAILNDFVKKYNFDLMGDDLCILQNDGSVFSFPKPMVLYPYHRSLFPDVFKNKITVPISFTKLMSRIVPKVKKMLSPFPLLMNFARNNNPQIHWVLPNEIYSENKICSISTIESVIWLERTITSSKFFEEDHNILSKIMGSTMNEFDQRIVFNCNILMGIGVLEYKDYFGKWYKVLEDGLRNVKKGRLNIETSVSINEVGQVVKDLIDE